MIYSLLSYGLLTFKYYFNIKYKTEARISKVASDAGCSAWHYKGLNLRKRNSGPGQKPRKKPCYIAAIFQNVGLIYV